MLLFLTFLKMKRSKEFQDALSYFYSWKLRYQSVFSFLFLNIKLWLFRLIGMFCCSQGTIHLRRRQILTIFDPYPPTIRIPANCLWRGFLILMYYDLLTIATWGHPSPARHADVLNGWSPGCKQHCAIMQHVPFWRRTLIVCRAGGRSESLGGQYSWIMECPIYGYKISLILSKI